MARFFRPSSGGSSAPSARAATVANVTGAIYTIARLLGGSSTFSLLSGSSTNLAVASSTGVVSATAAIGVGSSQLANVREVAGSIAVEYPLTLSGGVTVPAAPTLTVVAGNAQNTLNWVDGSTGGAAITAHYLYRGTTPGGEVFAGTITTASPYIDLGLTNGTAYYYKLAAVNSAGQSAFSTEASGTPSLTLLSQMPATPLGLYTMDKYSATPRKTLQNQASGAALSPNLLSTGRRYFKTAPTPYVSNACTVTDGATSPVDGNPYAATIVGGGAGWFLRLNSTPGITNGTTVTFSLDVKTTDSSTVVCTFGKYLTTKTITPTLQRLSFTWSFNGEQIWLLGASDVSSQTASFIIDNATLHFGSVDLGRDALAAHIMFGDVYGDSLYTPAAVSGGLMDLVSGQRGWMQFDPVPNFNNHTLIAIGSRNTLSAGSYNAPFMAAGGQHLLSLRMDDAGGNGGSLSSIFAGGQNAGQVSPGTTWPRINELHSIVNRYDGTTATIFQDDAKAVSKTNSGQVTGSLGDFFFANYTPNFKLAAMAIYNRALTDAETRTAVAALKAYVTTTSALTVAPNTKYVVIEGDSITRGYLADAAGSYANRGALSWTSANGIDFAPDGSKLGTSSADNGAFYAWGRLAGEAAIIPPNKNGRLYIYTLMIGTNDIHFDGVSAATLASRVSSFAAAVKAAGFDRFVLCTLLPATDAATIAGFNAIRNTYNTIIKGAGWAAANNVDVICDLASVSGMGADSDASGANYADGVHPSTAGQILLAPTFAATINALT